MSIKYLYGNLIWVVRIWNIFLYNTCGIETEKPNSQARNSSESRHAVQPHAEHSYLRTSHPWQPPIVSWTSFNPVLRLAVLLLPKLNQTKCSAVACHWEWGQTDLHRFPYPFHSKVCPELFSLGDPDHSWLIIKRRSLRIAKKSLTHPAPQLCFLYTSFSKK